MVFFYGSGYLSEWQPTEACFLSTAFPAKKMPDTISGKLLNLDYNEYLEKLHPSGIHRLSILCHFRALLSSVIPRLFFFFVIPVLDTGISFNGSPGQAQELLLLFSEDDQTKTMTVIAVD